MKTKREVLGRHSWPYGANEPETQALLLDWASRYGLRYAGHKCLHWVASGRCAKRECWLDGGRNAHSWMDHCTAWINDQGGHVLVCQPYVQCQRSMRDLCDAADKFNLDCRIDGAGWYGVGTIQIMLTPKEQDD